MQAEVIEQGFVTRTQESEARPVTSGPRTAITREGDVICTYMAQSKLGINDFVPMLSRSTDNGANWQDEGAIWPHLTGKVSIFAAISSAASGALYMYGTTTQIDRAGEAFWSEETQGMKQNTLFWAVSHDHGKSWSDPQTIPMPIPGAAEAPGPLCVTRDDRRAACYSPYRTFDADLPVDCSQVVCVYSDDEGKTWRHSAMHRFEEEKSGGAEAWVIQLSDGRLLGTSWHVDNSDEQSYPNAWSLSSDGGENWTPTASTGIMGQSTALAALPNGKALFVYNQRTHGEVGVWIAQVQPTDTTFGIAANQIVWKAETTTQNDSSGLHDQWCDFSFGEPAVTVLPDGNLLLVFWCIQPEGQGIRYVKLTT